MRAMRLALVSLLAVLLTTIPRARAQSESEAESAEPRTGEPRADTTDAIPEPPGTPEAQPEATSEQPPPQPAERRRLVVVDVASYGIDPVVGRVATQVLRRTGESMGYDVVDAATTVAAAQRLRMPYPPTPADLWRVTWVAQAHRGAFARVWAAEGRYVVELTVASLDGQGPWFGRDTAGADDLRQVIERLLRAALPTPDVWQEGQQPPRSPVQVTGAGARPPLPATVRPPLRPNGRRDLGDPTGRTGRWRPPEPELRRWTLVLQTEASIGTSEGSYYNHLVGARLDFRILRDLLLGAYVAYVNLQGRDDRVSNLFFLLQGEYRIRPVATLDLSIPLRIGVGYLPFNGPVLRVAAGVNYALTPNWEIGADLITPTFFFLPDRVAVSMDIALEVGYRF